VARGRISSAVLVQLKGWQRSFQLSTKVLIAVMSCLTLSKDPRRIAFAGAWAYSCHPPPTATTTAHKTRANSTTLANLQHTITLTHKKIDIAAWFAGLGGLLVAAAVGLSLCWNRARRLPKPRS
jgi:hypothetical protein